MDERKENELRKKRMFIETLLFFKRKENHEQDSNVWKFSVLIVNEPLCSGPDLFRKGELFKLSLSIQSFLLLRSSFFFSFLSVMPQK